MIRGCGIRLGGVIGWGRMTIRRLGSVIRGSGVTGRVVIGLVDDVNVGLGRVVIVVVTMVAVSVAAVAGVVASVSVALSVNIGGVSVSSVVTIIHLDANVAVASADSGSNANDGKDEDLFKNRIKILIFNLQKRNKLIVKCISKPRVLNVKKYFTFIVVGWFGVLCG